MAVLARVFLHAQKTFKTRHHATCHQGSYRNVFFRTYINCKMCAGYENVRVRCYFKTTKKDLLLKLFEAIHNIMANQNNTTEQQRLTELYNYKILDSEAENDFDDLAIIASELAGTPISAISLIDYDRQWLKAKVGLAGTEIKREISFCSHAIQEDTHMVIPNTLEDDRFSLNPLVLHSPGIKFYAGFPLVTPRGFKIGTLCVLDKKPRKLSESKLNALSKLAQQVMKLIELRLKNDELTKLKQNLEGQKTQLGEMLDHQRKLMAILAHDTRGPLGGMQALLNLYTGDEILAEESKEVFSLIDGQIEILLSLIDNITSWGFAYINAKDNVAAEIDIRAIVNNAIAPFQQSAKEKNISISNDVKCMPRLTMQKDELSFIVRNLINNSVKFSPSGQIKIYDEPRSNTYALIIEDTGIGIPTEIRERLFKNPVHSREGTSHEKGSGLGLMLIHDFIKQVKGTIIVLSEEGKGTKVIIELQVAY